MTASEPKVDHVALVLDGDPLAQEELRELAELDAIVAADGAAAQLLDQGIVPDWIVGDMDGLGEARARDAEARGARLLRHGTHKARTDGSLAREHVQSLEPGRVTVYGALGGRFAMSLVNLQDLASLHRAGIETTLRHGQQSCRFLGAGDALEVPGPTGRVFNVLAWLEPCRVTIQGARYPTEALQLAPLAGTAVSNEVADAASQVLVEEGCALLIVEGAPDEERPS